MSIHIKSFLPVLCRYIQTIFNFDCTFSFSKISNKMASKLIIFSLLTVAWAATLSKPEQEPQCYSRFDYEYKVVQKLVDLDNGQNEQKGDSATQLDRIKAIEAELENINSTSREKLQTLENTDREQDETVNEMKTALEEVKSQNEVMVSEIEKLKEKSAEIKGQATAFSTALGDLTNIQTGQTIVFDHIILNVGGAYDVNSGKFTCPKSGVYLITFFIGNRDTSGEGYESIASLVVNSVEIIEAQAEGKHRWQDLQGGNAVVIKLNKEDQVWVKQRTGNKLASYKGRTSSFSGVLLYPSD